MEEVLKLTEWNSSATRFPETQYGNVRIKKTVYPEGFYNMYGILGKKYFLAERDLTITTLQELKGKTWKTWMVDDPPHYHAMNIYANMAYGTVLVAGLGLGMLVEALERNPLVRHIVVVEMNRDVINLIRPLIPHDKTYFLIDDFYKFVDKLETGAMPCYDFVICDIWVAGGIKQVKHLLEKEVKPLNARLKKIMPRAKMIYHGFGKV